MQPLNVKILKSISDLTPKESAALLEQFYLASNGACAEDSDEPVKKPEMVENAFVLEVSLNTATMKELNAFQSDIDDDRIVQFWDEPTKKLYEEQHSLDTKSLAYAGVGGATLFTGLSLITGEISSDKPLPAGSAFSIPMELCLCGIAALYTAKKWLKKSYKNNMDDIADAEKNAQDIKQQFKEIAQEKVVDLNRKHLREIEYRDDYFSHP